MRTHLSANRRRFSRYAFARSILFIICWYAANTFDAQAQLFYMPKQFGEIGPDISGILGNLYNPEPYLVTNVPITYHRNENVYATAYLPFIQNEYDAGKPVELFGSYYTTGIALCSPRRPDLGLYAPVQVISQKPESNESYALSSLVPFDDNRFNYKGPFNDLLNLNTEVAGFINPVSSQSGVTVLANAQNFTRFSHEILTDQNDIGWNGFDKAGNIAISCVIKPIEAESELSLDRIFFHKNLYNDLLITRRQVASMIASGILHHTNGYDAASESASRKELDKLFVSILGHSFSIWQEAGNFDTPNWDWFWEKPVPLLSYHIDNPKASGYPSTYLGTFYNLDPTDLEYKDYTNLSVGFSAFHYLIDGKTGYVDDMQSADIPFNVLQLIPGSRNESYKLALRIFFRAFTEKLTNTASYPDLRVATLEAAKDLGYPPGSHAYSQLMEAWSAVGVQGFVYNENCTKKSAQSLLNGLVSFNARERTLSPDAQSQRVIDLLDCSDSNGLQTMYKKDDKNSYFTDWDNDQIYSDLNDETKSQYAVSIHTFTQVARDWFKSKFGQDGMDGTGQSLVQNILGDYPKITLAHGLTKAGKPFTELHYPYAPLSACRDQISKYYMASINYYVKYEEINNEPINPVWAAIYNSLIQIFSLEIKKDYEREKQNVNAENIWTLYEDVSDPAYAKDFSNPKLYGQTTLYKGINWDDNTPGKNAGFMNLCYYFLVHGTDNPDDPNDQDGYTNDEPNSLTYFVNKIDRNLVLNVFWEAYKATPANSSVEEFRLATLKALHSMGSQYDGKSKEHIAFYDAWAAVLGLPDYASTLKHVPGDNESIYPWIISTNAGRKMIGVEVEYPQYESARIFEVSQDPLFKDANATVYRFQNYIAPDLATGMTYGEVNLEPGKTYYTRSRLYKTGGEQGCKYADDPEFCSSLQSKAKWTVTYSFETGKIDAVSGISPEEGKEIAAWESPLSWQSTAGAGSYELKIADQKGTVGEQTLIQEAAPYDEENPQVTVSKTVALSKDNPYKMLIAARQRTGSPEGVKLPLVSTSLPDYEPLSQAEKEDLTKFPYAYGAWGPAVTFSTDIPKITLGTPADGKHLPMMGQIQLTAATSEPAADYYHYKFYFDHEGNPDDIYSDVVENNGQLPSYPVDLQGLKYLKDQKAYAWSFTPRHKAKLPFIPEDEAGEEPGLFHFVVDKNENPMPTPDVYWWCVNPDETIVLNWKAVEGATGYKYVIYDGATNAEVVSGITDQLQSPTITNASKYPSPGKYYWGISAGVKDANGEWAFGKENLVAYNVRPLPPTMLSPDNNNSVPLGPDQGITFKWAPGADPNLTDMHLFTLTKNNGAEIVQGLDQQPTSGKQITHINLEFDTQYQWKVDNQTGISSCRSDWATGVFRTEKEPIKIIPELGFSFLLLAPDAWGFDLGGITYNVSVTNPDGTLGYTRTGMVSNSTNQVSYSPGSLDPNNGKLSGMSGKYKVTVVLTHIDDYVKQQKSLPIWGYGIYAMDVAPLVQGTGQAVQIDTKSNIGNVNPLLNATIKFEFDYDPTNNTLN